MKHIKVRNWDRWQTYRKDRNPPPWIKLHRCLLRNIDWVSLSDAQRGQLVSMWMLAADSNGVIPNDSALIAKLCQMQNEPDLKLLRDKGFLDFDAKVTPTRRQPDATMTPAGRQDDAPESDADADADADPKAKADVGPVTPERVPELLPGEYWIMMPVKEGMEPITEADILGWEALYGRIDVRHTVKQIVGHWASLDRNLRKTRKGIRKSINTWLAKDDGRAGTGARGRRVENPYA